MTRDDIANIEAQLDVVLPKAYVQAALAGRFPDPVHDDAQSIIAVNSAFRAGDFGDQNWRRNLVAIGHDGGGTRISHGNPKLRHNLHQQMVLRLSCPERRALTCPAKSLPAAEIEAAVVDQIRCIARDKGLRNEVLRQARSSAEDGLSELAAQQRQLKSQLARDHAEIGRLAVMPDPSSATTARIADLHQRIARSEAELKRVKSRIADIEKQRVRDADVAAAFADFDNVWAALSSQERAQVLSLLVARVEFDPDDSTLAISFHPSAITTLAEGSMEDAA